MVSARLRKRCATSYRVKPVFVRPDTDSKAFDGAVKDPQQLEELLDQLPADLELSIAAVVSVDLEYHIFLVAGSMLAASEYRRKGRLSTGDFVPNNVINLAIDADITWRPADCYVVCTARSVYRIGIVQANFIIAARLDGAGIWTVGASLCHQHG